MYKSLLHVCSKRLQCQGLEEEAKHIGGYLSRLTQQDRYVPMKSETQEIIHSTFDLQIVPCSAVTIPQFSLDYKYHSSK